MEIAIAFFALLSVVIIMVIFDDDEFSLQYKISRMIFRLRLRKNTQIFIELFNKDPFDTNLVSLSSYKIYDIKDGWFSGKYITLKGTIDMTETIEYLYRDIYCHNNKYKQIVTFNYF